jgi:HAD superfamily phosphoserine phosphatase-like hydrolase
MTQDGLRIEQDFRIGKIGTEAWRPPGMSCDNRTVVASYESCPQAHGGSRVAILDFDKTLISVDSFQVFSLLASKKLHDRAIVLLLTMLAAARLIGNGAYKRCILRLVWRPKNNEEKRIVLDMLYAKLMKALNLKVLTLLKQHLSSNERILVVSASPQFYVEAFVRNLASSAVVSASVFDGGTGSEASGNVYGERKVTYVREFIALNRARSIVIYTDSISDLPIIKLATEVNLVNPSRRFRRRLQELKIDFEIIR